MSGAAQNGATLLSVTGVSKAFPGVQALSDVNFEVAGGEVVSLVGQNGAGKSTLMSIIGGVHAPDRGAISVAGKQVAISSPATAEELGIGYVHQEPTLVPNMTVAANIFLNRELLKRRTVLDFKRMRAESEKLTGLLGFDIRPDRLVGDLALVEKEVVEIAKAMLLNPRVLILDEVTAPLNSDTVEHLFELIATLKAQGIGIIFISHRLDEVVAISDRIVVLRDGCKVGDLSTAEDNVSERDIITLMLGKKSAVAVAARVEEAQEAEEATPETASDVQLSVRGLSNPPHFENVSFALGRGELLGFAGLKGSGVSEILKTVYGAMRKAGGEVFVDGEQVAIKKPRDAIRNGIGMLTNDRQREGLALTRKVGENITVASLDNYASNAGFLRRGALRERVEELVHGLSIKTSSVNEEVLNLSGGNQQKVVLAKWLLRDLDVVIADEPTRGVDVRAKEEIYKLLTDLKAEGKGMIIYSPEIPELLATCDRIIVIDSGHRVGEIQRGSAQFNEEDILELMHAAPGRKRRATLTR